MLVLPNVSILDETEKQALERFTAKGGRMVVTGADATGFPASQQIVRMAACPAKSYFAELQRDFAGGSRKIPKEFLQAIQSKSEIVVEAPASVAANLGRVNGAPHIFLANFGGLVPRKVAIPSPAAGIRVGIPAAMGDTLAFLPFLGETQILHGVKQEDRMEFTLPAVQRGAVVWVAGKK